MICDRFNAVIDMLWSILAETVDGGIALACDTAVAAQRDYDWLAYQWSLSAHNAMQQSHSDKIADDMASPLKPSARCATPRSHRSLIACTPQPQQ